MIRDAVARWRIRRACFHHDIHAGTSWVTGQLIDLGRRKMFVCSGCDKTWIV